MITLEYIEDLKTYSKEYEEFCKQRTCQEDECIVLKTVGRNDKRSCFKTYCELRKSGIITPNLV